MAEMDLRSGQRSLAVAVAASAAAVALVTIAIYGLREVMPVAGAGVLYLLPVLLASRWGMWLGIATAVAQRRGVQLVPHSADRQVHDRRRAELGRARGLPGCRRGHERARRRSPGARAEEADRRRREADLTAEMARVLLGGSDLEDRCEWSGSGSPARFDLAAVELTTTWKDSDKRSRALPIVVEGDRAGTILVPRTTEPEVVEAIEERVIPSLETLLTARPATGRARGAGDRDQGAAALERGQDRAAALGLPRPALAADGDHGGRRRPGVADPRRRRPRGARLGDLDRVRAAHATGLQLLDLSRIQSGEIEPRTELCTAEELIGAALDAGRRCARGLRHRHRRRPAADPALTRPSSSGRW